MKALKALVAAAAACLLMSGCASKPSKVIVGYYPSFNSGEVLPVERLKMVTHINLSFATVDAEGNVSDARVRRSAAVMMDSLRAAGCKVLVSVGGGGGRTTQENFAACILDDAARANAVSGLMKLVNDLGLDGLDIDYEAWRLRDEDYDIQLETALEKFLSELRSELGPKRWLTAAVATYGRYNERIADLFDYVTVMAYDLTGPWTKTGGPHSPFEYFTSALDQFEAMGFPRRKLVGGVPFYGYGFPGGTSENAYAMTYSEIVSRWEGSEMVDVWNDELYYDGIPTIERKCDYINDGGYGGIMFWQINGDTPDPQKSLLVRIYKKMTATCR